MTDQLSPADVDAVAALARLELTAEERVLFQRQLSAILEYARHIAAVATADVAPTAHALAPLDQFRDDEPVPSLPREEALANAPDASREAGLFRVPRIIGA
jgi:aspartyl-tRNA(Asn)/glutamyl-tRNA(Gln) amidotransferase subunit C